MNLKIALAAAVSAAVATGTMLLAANPSEGQTRQQSDRVATLRPVSSFAGIRNSRERSVALFREGRKR